MNASCQTLLLLCHLLLWHSAFMWDVQFLLGYILPLAKMLETQEVNWFISQHMNTEESESVQYFMQTIHTKTSITQTVMTNRTDVRLMKTENKRNYMGLVLTTGPDDYIMTVHDKVLTGRHYYMNFVILVKRINDFRVAEQVLYGMSRSNFQNSFLYVGYVNGSSDLFGARIFPDFQIEIRTDLFGYLKSEMGTSRNGRIDCMGFKFKTPLRLDVPGVFMYRDRKGNTERQGISYKIMDLFMDYVNASLEVYEMPKDKLGGDVIDMHAALDLVRKGKVLLLGHSYALSFADEGVDQSYPIMVVRWCLMVPVWNTLSAFYYPLKPFDGLVWDAVLLTFCVLSITDCLWIACHSVRPTNVRNKKTLVRQLRNSVLENFCFVINIAATRTIKNPSNIRFLFYATVWFHGFFLSANYTSLLGSILTVTLFREQINTIDDLVRANLSVMIINYEYDFLLSGGLNLTADFLKLITRVDAATFNQHQMAMNKSFAYFVTDDKWHFLELQQKHLKHGLFKFTDICFGSYYLGYPMESDSPIWRALEYFLFSIHSSGLLHHYESHAFDHALNAGLVQRFTAATEYRSAQMEHVMLVFWMLLAICAVSSVVFLGECGHYWLRKRMQVNGTTKDDE